MLSLPLLLRLPKQESVSLVIRSATAITVVPKSASVQEDIPTTRTLVETMHIHQVIMEQNTSDQWAISWFSN